MKLPIIKSLLILAVIVSVSASGGKKDDSGINDTCNREESSAAVKKEMVPFRYERTTTTRITFKNYDQVKEVAIPLFFDTDYKFVINTEGLPKDITVEIYDQPMGLRKGDAQLIKTSTEKMFSFELDDTYLKNRVYINYIIPAVEKTDDDVIQKGCVVLGSGYKNV